MIRADEFIGAVGRLDAEVGQYLRHDARRHGRGHVAAGAVGAGVVAGAAEGEEHHDLRVVRRRAAGERNGDAPVDLVGSAGLAADAVARDLAVLARAVLDLVLHDLAHGLGGILGNDLPQRGGVVAVLDVAAFFANRKTVTVK